MMDVSRAECMFYLNTTCVQEQAQHRDERMWFYYRFPQNCLEKNEVYM